MSKSATIIGMLLGIIILILSMVDFTQGKIISAFFNWQGLLVVLGGTFAATLINYPLNQIPCFFKSFGIVFGREPDSTEDVIQRLLDLGEISHSKTILALEKELDSIDDKFLKDGITNALIYKDETQLRFALENNLNATRLRHLACQDMFNNMASYAPAFGMMGTVMGLIIMMTTQVASGDAAPMDGGGQDVLGSLLQGMGLALVTTFYGVLFSNLLFIPIAGKLKVISDAEVFKNEVIIEGLMGIKRDESPLMLREILFGFVNQQTKLRLERLN